MKVAWWHTVALPLIMAISALPSHAQDTDDAAIRRLLGRVENAVRTEAAVGKSLGPIFESIGKRIFAVVGYPECGIFLLERELDDVRLPHDRAPGDVAASTSFRHIA